MNLFRRLDVGKETRDEVSSIPAPRVIEKFRELNVQSLSPSSFSGQSLESQRQRGMVVAVHLVLGARRDLLEAINGRLDQLGE